MADIRIYNQSRDDEFHTQRNNAVVPLEACNVTAMVMALKQVGWTVPHKHGTQPEDALMQYLRSKKGYAALDRLAGDWAVNQTTGQALYSPNEVHVVLEWAVNTIFDAEIDTFRTDWNLMDLVELLKSGGGIVLSGKMPHKRGAPLNHVMSLAGCYEDAETGALLGLIIDDPFGNYHTGYSDHHGNNIKMPFADAVKLLKNQNTEIKWAHVIQPKESV